MTDLYCKTCGGRLEVAVGSDTAVCGNCGLVSRLDADVVRSVAQTHRAAVTDMGSGTEQGYRDAIEKFRSIPFVAGTQDRIAECQKRLEEIEEARQRREKAKQKTEGGGAGLGIALIVIAVLVIAAIIAGAIYVIYNLVHGTLSPTAMWISIAAAALAVIIFIVGKVMG